MTVQISPGVMRWYLQTIQTVQMLQDRTGEHIQTNHQSHKFSCFHVVLFLQVSYSTSLFVMLLESCSLTPVLCLYSAGGHICVSWNL